MTIRQKPEHVANAGKKSDKKAVPSKLEKTYGKYFSYEESLSNGDPFKQVSLFDYSVPVTTGASTATA